MEDVTAFLFLPLLIQDLDRPDLAESITSKLGRAMEKKFILHWDGYTVEYLILLAYCIANILEEKEKSLWSAPLQLYFEGVSQTD